MVVEGEIACGFLQELVPGILLKLFLWIRLLRIHCIQSCQFFDDLSFGGFQHAFQPTQNGERQDDPSVLGLLEITAQQIGQGPDIGGGLGES